MNLLEIKENALTQLSLLHNSYNKIESNICDGKILIKDILPLNISDVKVIDTLENTEN